MRTRLQFETSIMEEDEGRPQVLNERRVRVTAKIEDLPGMAGEKAVTIEKVEEKLAGEWAETLDWESMEWRFEEEALAMLEKRTKGETT